jgi:hypothetical protein
VLQLAEELRRNGVEALIDAWDLRPGDDIPKFMERGVRDSDRVLMICTANYVAKANDGLGGVGYEAMIVTSQLVRDLGTAKFIPIIRQSPGAAEVPTSVSTRLHINLSEGADREAQMQILLRELHSIPPEKPPLGRSPFAAAAVAVSRTEDGAPDTAAAALEVQEATQNPSVVYRTALKLAQSGSILEWRKLVAVTRRSTSIVLKEWLAKYGTIHPGEVSVLVDQSLEGIAAFAPLTAIALAGVTSANPKFSNQIGLLEDILNPSEWQRSGFVVRTELPESGAFAYQAMLGATCLYIGNVRSAIELTRSSTVDRRSGAATELWQRHNVVVWPESLGKNADGTWQIALGFQARWPWISQIFSDEIEYQAALYAYYVTMSFVEFVMRVEAKFEIPEDLIAARWWPDVPAFFERTPDEAKRRGYQLVLEGKDSIRLWLSDINADMRRLIQLWPKWVTVQKRIFAQQHPMSWTSELSFERLIGDILG